jgi:HlyD family secretion protein
MKYTVQNTLQVVQKNKVITGIVVVVILGSFFLFRGEKTQTQTLTVTSGDFLQEVSVSGKVVAAQTVDLAFNPTGRVSGVFAKVGDSVTAGTILASIENGDARGEVLQKEAALEAAEADLTALKIGARPEEIAVSQAEVDAAQSALLDAEKTLTERISDAYIKSDDAVRAKADQLFSNARTSNPQLLFETDSQLKSDIIEKRFALEGALIAWNDNLTNPNKDELATEVVAYLSQVKNFLEKLAFALNNLSASASLSQTTIDGWKSDLSTARTNVSTVTSNLVSAIGGVSSAKASLLLSQRELTLKQSPATAETIAEQEAQIKAARADLVSAQSRYQKTLVIAPFRGVVSKMDAKVGGVASSNESLISMISADNLEIESFVPEINAPLVKVGDVALVSLDAYGERVLFNAEVISVDPAETIRDGVSTYRARLRFLDADPRIKSGMTANIVITTEKKDGVITVPQGIVTEKNGVLVVPVFQNGVFVDREVEIGSVSSLGTIEIISGLSVGDVVSLELNK